MNFGNISPKHFADSMFGPEDERKETCIHCGTKWYAKHFKDGLCSDCQGKNVPGLTEIEKREKRRINVIKGLFVLIVTLTAILIFK